MRERWQKWLENKKIRTPLLAGCAILLAMVLFLPTSGDSAKKTEVPSKTVQQTDREGYVQELEKRVERILEQIDGVGRVDVMISLKDTGQKVLQEDVTSEKTNLQEEDGSGGSRTSISQSEQTKTVFENDSPYIVQTLEPQIEGIVVVAEGADSAAKVSEIHSAVLALFDLPGHKIQVLKKKSG